MDASPHVRPDRPRPPTVTDLLVAPELAALALLDAALQITIAALLAEHMTLIDELRPPARDGPVVDLADAICRRASSLRDLLARYASAVRDAARPTAVDPDADLPF